jgi:epoxyqueuosine reductase
LKTLLQQIHDNIGQVHGRGFVDSAPVLERSWAQRSGLGWIGKNGNLINKNSGSFFFIATLIIDLELDYDSPIAKDYCGSCRRCIDACPTDAILDNKVIDGSSCISYFTIELKDQLIPGEMKDRFDDGCSVAMFARMYVPGTVLRSQLQRLNSNQFSAILNFTNNEWKN